MIGLVANLSVIIPTLNESAHLAGTLEPLVHSGCEIIVVDGGSDDSTPDIATACDSIFLPSKTRGRSFQMNLGATSAQGDLFLFLHADTILSPLAITNLTRAFEEDPDLTGGSFFRFFDSESRFLRTTCHWANWRTRRWGIFLGDQGIFVRSSIFRELNGFREDLPYGEDLDFSIRLRKLGKTIALEPPVISSARRFYKLGPLRQTVKDLLLTLKVIRMRK